MKLEKIPEYLTATVVVVVGVILALYAGKLSGAGQYKQIVMAVAGVVGVILGIRLRAKSWMMIPLLGAFGGTFPALHIPITLEALTTAYVFGIFLVLKALKIVRRQPTFDLVDFFLLCMLLLLAAAFIRNPVGLLIFGSERIAGKAYVYVVIACLGYWVLARATLTPQQAQWLPLATVFVTCCDSFTGFIGDHFPGIGSRLSQIYSGFATSEELNGGADVSEDEIGRILYLKNSGGSITQAATSYFNPISLLNPLYFFRFSAFFIGVFMILFSGFRSALVGSILFFLTAGWVRSGWSFVLKSVLLIVPAFAIIIIAQGSVINLPMSVQRTLSFLPGHWDADAKANAVGSTNWRFEMWKDALTTDVYIHNKWLGDGFGVNRREWEAVQEAMSRGIQLRLEAESQAIMGGFHSGPISTIRYVGYVGLVFYYFLIFALAAKGLRLVRAATGTPFFNYAIFNCVGWIIHPFGFTFIFGAFDSLMPAVILGIGYMKLLENALADYRAQERAEESRSSEMGSLAPNLHRPLPSNRPELGGHRPSMNRPLPSGARG